MAKPRVSRGRPRPSDEIYVFDRVAIREVDRIAVEEFGIPSLLLMENASRHAADVALGMMERVARPRVLIVAGTGNNGGDGLAAARHLSNAGLAVGVLLAADDEDFRGDAACHLSIVRRMRLPVEVGLEGGVDATARALIAGLAQAGDASARGGAGREAGATRGRAGAARESRSRGSASDRLSEVPDLVVDALFGTGLDREISGVHAELVALVNELGSEGAKVLAVDIPSGLDAETGEPHGIAVRADVTVTFVGLKTGMRRLKAQEYVGDVVVGDIGAPRELVERLGTRLEAPKEATRPRARRKKSPQGKGRSR
jgi:NAD(P)H-hydrate epimerase